VIESRRPIDDLLSFHRVVAVGGESVPIKGGRIYFNDELFDEKSLSEYVNLPRTVIPQNQLFARLRIGDVIGRVTCVWMSQEQACVGTEVR